MRNWALLSVVAASVSAHMFVVPASAQTNPFTLRRIGYFDSSGNSVEHKKLPTNVHKIELNDKDEIVVTRVESLESIRGVLDRAVLLGGDSNVNGKIKFYAATAGTAATINFVAGPWIIVRASEPVIETSEIVVSAGVEHGMRPPFGVVPAADGCASSQPARLTAQPGQQQRGGGGVAVQNVGANEVRVHFYQADHRLDTRLKWVIQLKSSGTTLKLGVEGDQFLTLNTQSRAFSVRDVDDDSDAKAMRTLLFDLLRVHDLDPDGK